MVLNFLSETEVVVAVAGRPSSSSGSTSSTLYEPNVWADLLDNMLHKIIALMSSFHDFLAFATVCRSWRTAASSFPSVYAAAFPPLHLKPDVDCIRSRRSGVLHILLSKCKWQLADPARTALSPRCLASRNAPSSARYLGSSYGYLIFSSETNCLLADAYTGTKVKTLKLESGDNYYYGILTAPPSSHNSLLLLCSDTSMIRWNFGTNSWVEPPFAFDGARILQIVSFKGQMFAIDFLQRLHTISLLPQFQEVAVVWEEDMVVGLHFKPWLVVCGDMLIMVDLLVCTDQLYGIYGKFQVFRLNFCFQPAKWMKMDKLENWALFITFDRRNPTFSCMNPERWGGKSNCIYIARPLEDSEQPWAEIEIGQPIPSTTRAISCSLARPHREDGHYSQLENLWVLPSFVYGFGQ